MIKDNWGNHTIGGISNEELGGDKGKDLQKKFRSSEQSAIMKVVINEKYKDKEYYKRVSDANKRKAKDPVWLKANAQAAKINTKKYWNDPEAQKKKSVIQKEIAKRPEMKKIAKRNGLLTTARHKDAVFQKKHRKLVKNALNDPANKKKHIESIKKRTESKEWQEANKKACDKRIKTLYNDPAYRKIMSERTKKAMNRKDVREKILKTAEKQSMAVVTPFGEFKSVNDAKRNCPVAFEGSRLLKPHLYYFKDRGPGKPTFETVVKTPHGTFRSVGPAYKESTGKNNAGGRSWWQKMTTKFPKKYYKTEEARREWQLVKKRKNSRVR
jgi:hypothetical protein